MRHEENGMRKVFMACVLIAVFFQSEKACAQTVRKETGTPVRTIARVPVESQSIASIGYHRRAKILEIEFRNGGIYQYSDVSAATYKKFLRSESKGQFFQRRIRGQYAYRRAE
jgi:hypothetical protein